MSASNGQSTNGSSHTNSLHQLATHQSAQKNGHGPPGTKDKGVNPPSSKGSSTKSYKSAGFVATLRDGVGLMTSYMKDFEDIERSDEGPNRESRNSCKVLRTKKQANPPHALSKDDAGFKLMLDRLPSKTEAQVVHSLHDFVCPSAEALGIVNRSNRTLRIRYKLLIDAMNDGWEPGFVRFPDLPKPQPDFCVGFAWEAFSSAQQEMIKHATRNGRKFSSTATMFFPFLACEAKSSKEPILSAVHQNAHTLTLAVMAVVELFRGAGIQGSIHRKILGFSIAYDPQGAQVFGHYPVMNGDRTAIYMHAIMKVYFDGNDQFAAYRFVKNMYEIWAPKHLDNIRKALDKLDRSWALPSDITAQSAASRATQTDASTSTVGEQTDGLQNLGLQSNAGAESRQASPLVIVQNASPEAPRPDPDPGPPRKRQRQK